jgi:predicted TIM-barrel fold metal-dependent hydrolase
MGTGQTTGNLILKLVASLLLVLCLAGTVLAEDVPPFADIHLHYKWNQAEVTSTKEAIESLQRNNIVLAVVSSTPPELALSLHKAAGDWVIPLYQPYYDGSGRFHWYRDKDVPVQTRQALQNGVYKGIGEIHLTAGIGPTPRNPILNALLKLAAEFNVPVLIHTESSSEDYLGSICQAHPDTRFLWAHAGGLLGPKQVAALLEKCPNVWVEFSARDHWKYVNSPIVDNQGCLTKDWQQVVVSHPHRFMTGSDPLWPVEFRNNWDTPDTGWQQLDELIQYHRRWLACLPATVEPRVRLENAREFFHVTPSGAD